MKITYKLTHKMEALQLNPIEYPHLSQWENKHLDQTLEKLSHQANPSKTEITQADKLWAATMLEMDLAAQSGAIWEDEEETPKWAAITEHNRKYYQQLEVQGKALMPAEPEVPEEVLQGALRQQAEGRSETQQNTSQGDRPQSERDSKTAITGFERFTLINKVASLSKIAKGNKVSNEQIKDLVNLLTFVDKDNTIKIKEGVTITDNIKDIVNHYKSGGITKDNRGVLDEYYTDEKLVNAVRNLIKDNFKGKTAINILEPSVGIGNFLHATTDLGVKTNVTAFEINDTTAKITKLLHPDTQVNLRSFETEFVTDNGTKKDFTPQYDLVVGNPPYGSHRGLYLGLGEETKLTRYEDYFVKRSLDVMNEGGTLAMVLPSSWLNRADKLSGAELTDAYRLPNGAFKATDIGTDIIILKKNSQRQSHDITTYFQQNPEKVLGETVLKKNRFGREEDYIKGNLDEALTR